MMLIAVMQKKKNALNKCFLFCATQLASLSPYLLVLLMMPTEKYMMIYKDTLPLNIVNSQLEVHKRDGHYVASSFAVDALLHLWPKESTVYCTKKKMPCAKLSWQKKSGKCVVWYYQTLDNLFTNKVQEIIFCSWFIFDLL